MAKETRRPQTNLCTYDEHSIHLRGVDLVDDMIGKMGFTEVFFRQFMNRAPSAAEVTVLDAILVTLMEHGLTPSAISARMIASSAPEALQAASAAGLLGVGSRFVGTIEDSALLLKELVDAPEGFEARAEAVIARYRAERKAVPGFGHHLHRPDDPRSVRLLALADELGLGGKYVTGIRDLSAILDRIAGKHLTINATGAIGALLCEIDVPPSIARGIAVVSRAAGLVAHIREEQEDPACRFIWDMAEHELSAPHKKG